MGGRESLVDPKCLLLVSFEGFFIYTCQLKLNTTYTYFVVYVTVVATSKPQHSDLAASAAGELFVLGPFGDIRNELEISLLVCSFHSKLEAGTRVLDRERERLMQKKEGSFVLRVPLLQHQH